jgi:ribosomal protein L32
MMSECLSGVIETILETSVATFKATTELLVYARSVSPLQIKTRRRTRRYGREKDFSIDSSLAVDGHDAAASVSAAVVDELMMSECLSGVIETILETSVATFKATKTRRRTRRYGREKDFSIDSSLAVDGHDAAASRAPHLCVVSAAVVDELMMSECLSGVIETILETSVATFKASNSSLRKGERLLHRFFSCS